MRTRVFLTATASSAEPKNRSNPDASNVGMLGMSRHISPASLCIVDSQVYSLIVVSGLMVLDAQRLLVVDSRIHLTLDKTARDIPYGV